MHYVYLTNTIVTDQAQVDPFTIFSTNYAEQFIEALDEVTFGWSYEDGEFIAPPPPPIVIPVLTMRQARLALLDAGLLDEVEAAITTPENRIWWDYSTTVERNHPLVDAVLTALGKSPEEIDEMFIEAAKL